MNINFVLKIGGLKSKIVFYAIKTDHWAHFDREKILISNVNDYNSGIFLEGWCFLMTSA